MRRYCVGRRRMDKRVGCSGHGVSGLRAGSSVHEQEEKGRIRRVLAVRKPAEGRAGPDRRPSDRSDRIERAWNHDNQMKFWNKMTSKSLFSLQ